MPNGKLLTHTGDALPTPVARVLDNLYHAGFEPEAWREGLTDLCGAVGARGACTVPRVAAEHTQFLPRTPELEEFIQVFVRDEWHKRDLRADRGWPLVDAGHAVLLEQDIVTPEDHQQEPLYQDFYMRFGMLWWSGISFKSLDRQYVVSLSRRSRDEPFSEHDRRLFWRMRGHLSRIFTMAEHLVTAAGKGGLDVLEAMNRGGILVDARARVIAMNRRAEKMLGETISIVGNRVAARHADSDGALQRLIAATLRYGPQGEGAVMVRRPLRRPVLIDVLPIPEAAGAPFLFGKALLMLIDLEDRPVPKERMLMRLFKMTPAEAALSVLLCSGMTLAQASDRLRITQGTARQRLKDVFRKTDIDRQAELVLLLSAATQGKPL